MKKNIVLTLICVLGLFSCNTDDDICASGEATPRVKIKFKNKSNGALKTLDSLYIAVDYGNGAVDVVQRAAADSVLLPLRVDDVDYTDLFIRTKKKGSVSKVRLNYQTSSEYVSPACGIKRNYLQLVPTVLVPQPVLGAETNLNEIKDENKTHIFLLF